jgi:subtilisin family serine protease
MAYLLLLVFPICAAGSMQEPSSTRNAPPQKVHIERADQLPRHVYRVATTATSLLQDDAQFAALSKQLEADLRSDLETYVINDRATLKSYYQILGDLALHRADYEIAVGYRDKVRELEDKPGPRLVTGIVDRALAKAKPAPADRFVDAFRQSFRQEVSALPYPQVRGQLTAMKAQQEINVKNNLLGRVQTEVEPAAKSGEISREVAQRLVRLRVLLDRTGPIHDAIVAVLGETIAAHAIEKSDIWAARDVSLDGRSGLTPVTLAIWDSGVDVELFSGQLFTNAREVPNNGKDDDGNGYVDDVNGIAHDIENERTTGVLRPLTLTPTEAAEYRSYLKGRSDNLSGVDSREAQAYRQKQASTPPEKFREWFEGMIQFQNYSHGTHVAGIAVRGNPATRILVARQTVASWRAVPQLPMIELARKRAREFRETVEYFKQNRVRVANMSWSYTPRGFEQALEANNAGGSAEQRRQLARRIFEIYAESLRAAIASAPEILFVSAAGNENADNRFSEAVPSSFELPNLVTAGAVDRTGNEARFTSYGKVEVYANGVEVPSRIPGGAVISLSGTSMSAPQVANLAAKLLALKPNLTVAELRRAIIEAADERIIGEGKRIRLLNPKSSLERVVRQH